MKGDIISANLIICAFKIDREKAKITVNITGYTVFWANFHGLPIFSWIHFFVDLHE